MNIYSHNQISIKKNSLISTQKTMDNLCLNFPGLLGKIASQHTPSFFLTMRWKSRRGGSVKKKNLYMTSSRVKSIITGMSESSWSSRLKFLLLNVLNTYEQYSQLLHWLHKWHICFLLFSTVFFLSRNKRASTDEDETHFTPL